MKLSTIYKLILVSIMSLTFIGCGGSDSSSQPTTATVTGTIVDDPVQGLSYTCTSGTSSVTNAEGEYTCDAGNDVTFYINGVAIGTIAAQNGIITPYSFFPNDTEAAINLARLLQSIDGDGDSNNGLINIDTTLAALLPVDTNFTNASFVTAVESALNITLVNATEAQIQLNDTIIQLGGTIPDGGHIPVANAGANQNIHATETATLDGSLSIDADSDPLTYSWSIVSLPNANSTATLTNPNTVDPTITTDEIGNYIIQLIVNDGTVDSIADTVTITGASNSAPISNAGSNQDANRTDIVSLDGSASTDPNGDSLTYLWSFISKPDNSTATFSDVTVVNPTFVADELGEYIVRLTCDDGWGATGGHQVTISVSGNTGVLDTNFDTDGIIVHNSAAGGNDNDYGRDFVIDSNGNIYIAGFSHNGTDYDMTVWKYTSAGILDTNFDTDGIVMHHNAAGGDLNDYAESIGIDTNGDIYVVGYSDSLSSIRDIVIWKYNNVGDLDTNFGIGGVVVHNSAAGGDSADLANDVTIDTSGNIYLTGGSKNTNNDDDMVILKYTSFGVLDANFGVDGIVISDGAGGASGSNDLGREITIDSNGSIYVTGQTTTTGLALDMVIWKYTSSGILDTTFASSGIVTHDGAAGVSGSTDLGYSIQVDNMGNIYVTGNSQSSMVIWKYNSGGTLDISFSTDGILVYGSNAAVGAKLQLDVIGNVYVAGTSDSNLAIWKYNNSGLLDVNFGIGGVSLHDSIAGGTGSDVGISLLFDSVDNIYATGYSGNIDGNHDMILLKFK